MSEIKLGSGPIRIYEESTCLALQNRESFFRCQLSRRKAFSGLGFSPSSSMLLYPTTKTSPPTLLRPNTCLGKFFPCVHSPFSLGVGISHAWFQNTIISGKLTHFAKCARSSISHLFFLKILRKRHYTIVPKIACKATTVHLYSTRALRIIIAAALWRMQMLGAYALGTHSRCRLSVCVYICILFTWYLYGYGYA